MKREYLELGQKKVNLQDNMALRLYINPTLTYSGLADFDSSAHVKVLSSNSVDIKYGKTIKWKMYLDKDDGYDGNMIFSFPAIHELGEYDNLLVTLDSSVIQLYMGSYSGSQKSYSISNYSNRILECEILKFHQVISSFSINGEILPTVSAGLAFTGSVANSWYIAGPVISINRNLKDATIWDIEIYDTSTAGSPRIHYWKGYPAGNTDAAWIDQEGSYNGTLEEIGPGIGTRNIKGIGGDSIANLINKLSIDGSINSKLLIQPPPPPATKTILAGTSSAGLLLSSDIIIDSETIPSVLFSSLGTEGLGNITVIDQYYNYYDSNFYNVYVTDQGYFVNYTADTSIQISSNSITAFTGNNYFLIKAGDSSGGNYESSDGGDTWDSMGYNLGGNQVNDVIVQSVRIS